MYVDTGNSDNPSITLGVIISLHHSKTLNFFHEKWLVQKVNKICTPKNLRFFAKKIKNTYF